MSGRGYEDASVSQTPQTILVMGWAGEQSLEGDFGEVVSFCRSGLIGPGPDWAGCMDHILGRDPTLSQQSWIINPPSTWARPYSDVYGTKSSPPAFRTLPIIMI